MQVQNRIPPAVLAAAAGMLQPFIPELSPQSLVAALKEFGDRKAVSGAPEKPMTRQEAAALLSVTLNTINRYLNRGTLRRIRLGPRAVRIDPASVRTLLEHGFNRQEKQ